MNRALEKWTNQFVKKPKTLFLMDSIGAFLTALILFAVLRNFNHYFGMPKTILTLLLAIAVCLCMYSAACFLLLKEKWPLYIRIISFANLLYCVLTVILLFIYYEQLTALGLIYFLGETAIILLLVYIELRAATKF